MFSFVGYEPGDNERAKQSTNFNLLNLQNLRDNFNIYSIEQSKK